MQSKIAYASIPSLVSGMRASGRVRWRTSTLAGAPTRDAPRRGGVGAALVIAGLVGLGTAAPLHGQTPPGDPPDDTTTIIPLAPLSVSVFREPLATLRAPYAVSAVDATELRLGRTGAFLEEALDALPGVQVQNRFNFAVGERLAIRGFGPRAQFGVRGVRVLVDGIPATLPDGQSTLDHVDLSTVGRAEVLRGPSSALYGNAAGGVLALTTESAPTGPVRPEARVVAGSDGLINSNALVSGTAGGAGVLFNVARLGYDGFRALPEGLDGEGLPSTYGAAERWVMNGRATRPTAGGTLRLTLNGVRLRAENPGSLTREQRTDPERPARDLNVTQRTRKDLDQGQAGVSWAGPIGGPLEGLVAEGAAWGILRSVLNPIPFNVIDLGRRAGGVRALLRSGSREGGAGSAGSAGRFSWGAGGELELQRDDRQNYTSEDGDPGDLTLDQLERVRAIGVFAQAALGVTDRIEVRSAIRHDHFRFEADDRFTGPDDPDDSGSRTMSGWSPTVGAVAAVAPAVSVWANVATSLETPTTTELVNRPPASGGGPGGSGGFNPELDPRRTTGYEIGSRGALVEDRLGYELVLFRADVRDELVPFEVPESPGRTFFRNAGASTHEGWEASLQGRIGGGLEARATWSRTDARFDDFEVDGEDFSGNRVPGLAPDRVQGEISQERSAWFWAAEAEWSAPVPVDDAGEEETDTYTLVDLRGGLRAVDAGPLTVSPFAGLTNVFDRRYTASVAVNAFGGRFYEPGPGRTFHVGTTIRWHRP